MKKSFLLFLMLLCSCLAMAQQVNSMHTESGYVMPLDCRQYQNVAITRFGPQELEQLLPEERPLLATDTLYYNIAKGSNFMNGIEYYYPSGYNPTTSDHGCIPGDMLLYTQQNGVPSQYQVYDDIKSMVAAIRDSLINNNSKQCYAGYIYELYGSEIVPVLYILHIGPQFEYDNDGYSSNYWKEYEDITDITWSYPWYYTNILEMYFPSYSTPQDVDVTCANRIHSTGETEFPSIEWIEYPDGYPSPNGTSFDEQNSCILIGVEPFSDEYNSIVNALRDYNENGDWGIQEENKNLLVYYFQNKLLGVPSAPIWEVYVPAGTKVPVTIFPYYDENLEKTLTENSGYFGDLSYVQEGGCLRESYTFYFDAEGASGITYGYPDNTADPMPLSMQYQPYVKRMYYDDTICLPVKYAKDYTITRYELVNSNDEDVRNSGLEHGAITLKPLPGSEQPQTGDMVYFTIDTGFLLDTIFDNDNPTTVIRYDTIKQNSIITSFKEGRFYTFAVLAPIIQQAPAYNGDNSGPQYSLAVEDCNAAQAFTLKIIPYYATFIGGENMKIGMSKMGYDETAISALIDSTAWNFDYNWAVSDSLGNRETGMPCYVPSYKTSVFVQPARVVLAEEPADTTKKSNWGISQRILLGLTEFGEEFIEEFIQYEDGYRINTCDSIHVTMNMTGTDSPNAFGGTENPNALVGNQQYLNYTAAVVDYVYKQRQWTIMGFPLDDVVSGDIYTEEKWQDANVSPFYIPTKGDMKNIRVWQKLYNHDMLSMQATGNNITIESKTWNTPANTVKQRYNPGTAVMMWILPVNQQMVNNDTIALHFPKRDTEYFYYRYNGTEKTDISEQVPLLPGKTARSARFAYGKAENGDAAQEMTVTLTATSPSTTFAFANPMLDAINIGEFMNANNLVKVLHTITGEEDATTVKGISVVNGKSSANFPNSERHHTDWLFPGEAVMITTNTTATSLTLRIPVESLKAYRDKRTDEEGNYNPSPAAHNDAILYMTSNCDDHTSYASIYENGTANNSYVVEEDAEALFLDNSLTPTAIYTVADNKALSVNGVATLSNIPVAIYAADSTVKSAKVTFNGVESFDGDISLLDIVTGNTTLIAEGDVLTLSTTGKNDNVRYFLQKTAHTTTDIDITENNDDNINIFVAADGTIQIVANDELMNVAVFNAAGQEVMKSEVNNRFMSCSLPTGVYMVKAYTQHNQTVKKVVVK